MGGKVICKVYGRGSNAWRGELEQAVVGDAGHPTLSMKQHCLQNTMLRSTQKYQSINMYLVTTYVVWMKCENVLLQTACLCTRMLLQTVPYR